MLRLCYVNLDSTKRQQSNELPVLRQLGQQLFKPGSGRMASVVKDILVL